ncbi:MAG TPA: hypothetical protein VEA41_00715 [Salinarimonas sp.]|nr:hypothetical protein [Salinarimonas sp.]
MGSTVLAFDRDRCRPASGARRGRAEVFDVTLARAAELGREEVSIRWVGYGDGRGGLIWSGETWITTDTGKASRHDARIAEHYAGLAAAWGPRPKGARPVRTRRGRR